MTGDLNEKDLWGLICDGHDDGIESDGQFNHGADGIRSADAAGIVDGSNDGVALPTWKIILMLIAWAFVAAFMGVVTAIVGTEILRLIGVVDDNTNTYQISINVIWAVVFVVVLAVPFVFRNRFISDQAPPEA